MMLAMNGLRQRSAQSGARQDAQLACFRLGEELYALDIMKIREIIRPQKINAVPKAPAFIEGVINLRGAVIPVVDMRRRFGLRVAEESGKSRVIICSLSGKIIGLLVDEVTEIRGFTREEVQPPPQFMQGGGTEYFIGVCRVRGQLVIILDLEKILSSEEKIDMESLRRDQAP